LKLIFQRKADSAFESKNKKVLPFGGTFLFKVLFPPRSRGTSIDRQSEIPDFCKALSLARSS
jgi:hypothetical protein